MNTRYYTISHNALSPTALISVVCEHVCLAWQIAGSRPHTQIPGFRNFAFTDIALLAALERKGDFALLGAVCCPGYVSPSWQQSVAHPCAAALCCRAGYVPTRPWCCCAVPGRAAAAARTGCAVSEPATRLSWCAWAQPRYPATSRLCQCARVWSCVPENSLNRA